MKILEYILTASVALLLAACSGDECDQNANSLPLAGFYSAESGEAVTLDSISVKAFGVPGDSLLLDSARSVSRTWLPFNLDAKNSSFIFTYHQKAFSSKSLADTVTFSYESNPWFVSTACGAIYKFKVLKIKHTSHLIYAVDCTMPDSVIDNTAGENIHIYFK